MINHYEQQKELPCFNRHQRCQDLQRRLGYPVFEESAVPWSRHESKWQELVGGLEHDFYDFPGLIILGKPLLIIINPY